MGTPVAARIRADLTPLGKGVVECNATILFDALEQPEEIVLFIDEIPAEIFAKIAQVSQVKEFFGSTTIDGTIGGASLFKAQIEFIKDIESRGSELLLSCYLTGFRAEAAG